MRMHCIDARVEIGNDTAALTGCDHVIVDIHCHQERQAFMSLAIGLRHYADDAIATSHDLGAILTLDFTQQEADAFLRTLQRLTGLARWHMAHPAPAYSRQDCA
jgi:hypothetical protein